MIIKRSPLWKESNYLNGILIYFNFIFYRINELNGKVENYRQHVAELDRELEEGTSELQQKFKELRKREEQMDDFLASFEDAKRKNEERIGQMEQSIVSLLEHISRTLSRFESLPDSEELEKMKKDLEFKEGELKKSETTAVGVSQEHRKLQQDVEQIEHLEVSVRQEIRDLQEKEAIMKMEIDKFGNLEELKREADEKKKYLAEEKTYLKQQIANLEITNRQLKDKCDKDKAALDENENYKQLVNLETKLKSIEANNFSAKDCESIFFFILFLFYSIFIFIQL